MQDISPTQRKVVIAACFGTFLEWYDFLTFASLATYFSMLFFPPDNPTAALLMSLATFGVGMIVRPLGSALFGSLADKYGRRPIFIATISLMGVTTFLVGMLPTYAQIGIFAPLLLLLLRLLQGFAVGGEIGGVAVYLTEHAPNGKRGMYTSVLQLMGPLGILVSTFQIVLLQAFLNDADFHTWGWRVPFLFSALLLFISIKTRMSLEESPVFRQLQAEGTVSKAPLRECLSDRHTLGRMALLFFSISAGGSLLFFSSQVYVNVFLKNVVRLDAQLASTLVMTSTLLLFPLTIFCGWLSDKVGRRPILLVGLILGAITIIPVFKGLQHYGNPALERFNREVVVTLYGTDCSYNPFRKAANDCERNQEFLTRNGVSYTLMPLGDNKAVTVKIGGDSEAIGFSADCSLEPNSSLPPCRGKVRMGVEQREGEVSTPSLALPLQGGGDVSAYALSGFNSVELTSALKARGWVEKADSAQVNRFMLFLLLIVPVVAVALITGPQTAVLAELFNARTRYSAAAVPHNLSAGWIGGLSPFMVTLLSVQAGDALAGLWYPVGMLIVASVVGLLFLPETRDVDLRH